MDFDLETEVIKSGQKSISNERRIEVLEGKYEETGKDVKELLISVTKISDNVEMVIDDQKRLESKLESLEQKPSKRFDLVLTTIITFSVTTGLNIILNNIMNGGAI